MKKLITLFSLLLSVSFGCYYDNFEELHPTITACDTTGTITYTNEIAAILSSNCGTGDIACHKDGNPDDIVLDNYLDVSFLVMDGSLMGSILHQPGFTPMPKNGGFLGDCETQKIQAWVNRGAPE
jgi:hypothetical protein